MWFLWRSLIIGGGLYGLAALYEFAFIQFSYQIILSQHHRQAQILRELSNRHPSEIHTDSSTETQHFASPLPVGTGTEWTGIVKQKRGVVHRLELQPSSWFDANCDWTVTASCAAHVLGLRVWQSATQSCRSDDATETPRHCSAWNKGTQQTVPVPRGRTRVVTVRCGGWAGWPRTLTAEWYRDGGLQPQLQSAHRSRGPPFAQTFEVHCVRNDVPQALRRVRRILAGKRAPGSYRITSAISSPTIFDHESPFHSAVAPWI